MKLILTLILILGLLLNNVNAQDSVKYSERPNGHNSPYRVAINAILENPDVYESTHLQVVGYLNLDWEADAIYESKNDFTANKGLWVHLNQFKFRGSNRLKGHFVVIDAEFDANDHGHENLWGGALKNITSIKRYRKPLKRN
jgi:hypothetical protein